MRLFWFFILCLLAAPAARAEVPVPSSRQQALEETEQDLKAKKAEIKELEAKAEELSKQLKSTQKDLVSVAEKITAKETSLIDLEKKVASYKKEQKEIEQRLEKDRGSMAAMILAVERIERVPPEALILKPDAPYKTAQTAMLLQSVLPQIHERSESFRQDVERLDTVLSELAEDQKKVLAEKAALEKEYASMQTLVDKRKSMVARSRSDFDVRQQEIKAISQQAATLKDLVSKLEEDKKRQEARAAVKKAVYQQPENLPRAGNAQLPISGYILTGFGETDDIGAQSQGVRVEGRGSGIVVAPMSGRVQFAGKFKNYGQLIILEHEKGYHSLIAGLDRIDIVVEQMVKAGEPMGLLPSNQDGEKPVLYFELRKNGKPINPADKIANLKS